MALIRELTDATATLLAGWMPAIDPGRQRVIATIIINTVSSTLLVLSREESPTLGDAIVTETKVMLVRYLSLYMEPPDEASSEE